MTRTAQIFNRSRIVRIEHDDLLGELQVSVSKPRPARPPAAPVPAEDALAAYCIIPPATPATGPPVACQRPRTSGKGGAL
jgi:hypothetical protein